MHRQLTSNMAKQKKIDDGSAQQKIKQAARKLFTEKGFDAVKTRDIAAEAGMNLALLNYYFRSKQKLFDIIMIENFEQFIGQLIPVLGDERLSLEERLTQVVGRYMDMLEVNPDLPFFIMNQMKSDASKLLTVREKNVGGARKICYPAWFGPLQQGRQRYISGCGAFYDEFYGPHHFPFYSEAYVDESKWPG